MQRSPGKEKKGQGPARKQKQAVYESRRPNNFRSMAVVRDLEAARMALADMEAHWLRKTQQLAYAWQSLVKPCLLLMLMPCPWS